jgi:hypothetical protein
MEGQIGDGSTSGEMEPQGHRTPGARVCNTLNSTV